MAAKTPAISIVHPSGAAALSPGQKKFNSLIQRIEAQRQLLKDWNEAVPLYQQAYNAQIVPLQQQFEAHLADLALQLEPYVQGKGLSKAQRQQLRELICEFAAALMSGENGNEMKALFNRNSDVDWDTGAAQAQGEMMAHIKDFAEREMGIESHEAHAMESPDELLMRLERELRARVERTEQAAHEDREPRRARRKPTAQQARAQAEAQDVSQSIREVFRQLASALHPDRETDNAERARKTALMQRVNQAYAKKDLLGLLQLQLEIEQIDPSALNGIAEDRLRHFITVLTDQLAELQAEVQDTSTRFKAQFAVPAYERVAPKTLPKLLKQQKMSHQVELYDVQDQLRTLVNERSIKSWLKANKADDSVQQLDDLLHLLGVPRY